jgi:N-succinyl-L-ornithine transcarbamylase
MEEHKTEHRPKVFCPGRHTLNLYLKQWQIPCGMMQLQNADFVITHPKGYELNPEITKNSLIEYDQNKAFENADFIYTKTGVVTATMEKLLIQIQTGPLLPRK